MRKWTIFLLCAVPLTALAFAEESVAGKDDLRAYEAFEEEKLPSVNDEKENTREEDKSPEELLGGPAKEIFWNTKNGSPHKLLMKSQELRVAPPQDVTETPGTDDLVRVPKQVYEYPRTFPATSLMQIVPSDRLDNYSCAAEAIAFGHDQPSGLILHEILCEVRKLWHYLLIAKTNIKSQLHVLSQSNDEEQDQYQQEDDPASLTEAASSLSLSKLMDQAPQFMGTFARNPENLMALPEILHDSIPVQGIRTTLTNLKQAVQKLVQHLRNLFAHVLPVNDVMSGDHKVAIEALEKKIATLKDQLMIMFSEKMAEHKLLEHLSEPERKFHEWMQSQDSVDRTNSGYPDYDSQSEYPGDSSPYYSSYGGRQPIALPSGINSETMNATKKLLTSVISSALQEFSSSSSSAPYRVPLLPLVPGDESAGVYPPSEPEGTPNNNYGSSISEGSSSSYSSESSSSSSGTSSSSSYEYPGSPGVRQPLIPTLPIGPVFPKGPSGPSYPEGPGYPKYPENRNPEVIPPRPIGPPSSPGDSNDSENPGYPKYPGNRGPKLIPTQPIGPISPKVPSPPLYPNNPDYPRYPETKEPKLIPTQPIGPIFPKVPSPPLYPNNPNYPRYSETKEPKLIPTQPIGPTFPKVPSPPLYPNNPDYPRYPETKEPKLIPTQPIGPIFPEVPSPPSYPNNPDYPRYPETKEPKLIPTEPTGPPFIPEDSIPSENPDYPRYPETKEPKLIPTEPTGPPFIPEDSIPSENPDYPTYPDNREPKLIPTLPIGPIFPPVPSPPSYPKNPDYPRYPGNKNSPSSYPKNRGYPRYPGNRQPNLVPTLPIGPLPSTRTISQSSSSASAQQFSSSAYQTPKNYPSLPQSRGSKLSPSQLNSQTSYNNPRRYPTRPSPKSPNFYPQQQRAINSNVPSLSSLSLTYTNTSQSNSSTYSATSSTSYSSGTDSYPLIRSTPRPYQPYDYERVTGAPTPSPPILEDQPENGGKYYDEDSTPSTTTATPFVPSSSTLYPEYQRPTPPSTPDNSEYPSSYVTPAQRVLVRQDSESSSASSSSSTRVTLVLSRRQLASALGDVTLSPGDIITISTRSGTLFGRVVDYVSPIAFTNYKPKTYLANARTGGRVWNLRPSDFQDTECRRKLNSLTYTYRYV